MIMHFLDLQNLTQNIFQAVFFVTVQFLCIPQTLSLNGLAFILFVNNLKEYYVELQH